MPKIVFVGQGGPLSMLPLKRLCDSGLVPAAIVTPQHIELPDGMNLIPVQPPRLAGSLAEIAHEHDILLIEWQKASESDIEAKLSNIAPDLVIMSCFPWRIPEPLLRIPQHGWWNLHPSLLPAYRGPNPLYWQRQVGESVTGMSLHQVEQTLDTGAIIEQSSCALTIQDDMEEQLGEMGGDLLIRGLAKLRAGTLVASPQDESLASYQPFLKQE